MSMETRGNMHIHNSATENEGKADERLRNQKKKMFWPF